MLSGSNLLTNLKNTAGKELLTQYLLVCLYLLLQQWLRWYLQKSETEKIQVVGESQLPTPFCFRMCR